MFGMAQGRYTRVESAPVNIGAIVRDTNREVDMSAKEMSLVTGVDPATLSRALDGDGPIDLWRFSLLPMRWWRVFLMKFSGALIASWFDERVSDLKRSA